MKRRKSTPARGRSSRPNKPVRLVKRLPDVYLGPGAFGSLRGVKGLLQGLQRPGQVDILEFQPIVEGAYRRLIESRFVRSGEWDTVGIVLLPKELNRRRTALVKDLVPGDVVLVCPEGGEKPEAYVNVGDELLRARLKISRKQAST